MSRIESAISKSKLDFRVDGQACVLLVVSFLLGRVTVLEKLYPFGIAFLGAYLIFKKPNRAVLAGVVAGEFSALGLGGFSYYLAAFLIYGYFTRYKDNKRYSLIVSSMIVAFIFLAARLIGINILDTVSIYQIILLAFEGVLVFTMTYLFSFSFPLEEFGAKEISNEKMICSFITLALVLSGLSNISIVGVSLKNVISIFLVLSLAYSQGIYMGATTGILLGMVAYISSVEMPFIIAILAVGGMLSGLFKELGKSGSIIGFILGNGIISYYINGLGASFLAYEELLLSAIMFLALYSKIQTKVEALFKPNNKIRNNFENRKFELASKKLSNMSELLESMAKTFKNTLMEEDVFSNSQIYTIIDDVKVNKCRGCENYNKCWEDNYYTTYYSLFTTIGILESNLENKEDLIKQILNDCNEIDELTLIINNIYLKYKEKEILRKNIKEQRLFLIEQLEGLGKVVDNINIDIYKNTTFNEELEELLKKEIKNKRIDIRELVVAQLTPSQTEIYLEFDSNNTVEKLEKVTKIVSNALGYPLVADYTLGLLEDTNKFKLVPTNRFSALTKVSEKANSENNISGDNFTYGEMDNVSFLGISDGMGTGHRANLESKVAIEILEKMMEINVDKELAIKTINNVLRTKANDEMFTTLDLSFIDLYKGRLQVIKSGASPTFIKRRDEVISIDSQSLPIGILKDVDFSIYEESIEDGDLIIMMSDGVLECNKENKSPEEWMKKLILGLKGQSPQAIADEILDISKLSCSNVINDDMTVMVTKVWRNNN